MLRYLAFLWEPSDVEAGENASLLLRRCGESVTPWHSALQNAGMLVLHAGAQAPINEAYCLSNQGGVVLGKLFLNAISDTDQPTPAHLDKRACDLIISSGGQHLIDRYWGRYVAFLSLPHSGFRVLRGPATALPCFVLTWRRVSIYFSWVDDCLALGLGPFTINWSLIGAFFVSPAVQSRETGLNEVSQLLPGECADHVHAARGMQRARSFLWSAQRIVETGSVDEPATAARMLRHTARGCVQSWASCHSSLLHRLSGGLDSAVVLGCMRDATNRPLITCVNDYSSGSNTDERGFARSAARAAGCELVERRRNPALALDDMLLAARTARPTTYLFYIETTKPDLELARARSATALFTGTGGDQLFYHNQVASTVADYVRARGLTPQLIRLARDAAIMERVSIWGILRSALRGDESRSLNPLTEGARKYRHLAAPEVIELALFSGRHTNPSMPARDRVGPGKRQQIFSLCVPMDYYDPLAEPCFLERVHPLLSQPLIELCLRIPSYVLARSGIDRALARTAFAPDIPPEIAARQSKGGMEEHAKSLFIRNVGFFRQLLLDGEVVRAGIVDRSKLEAVLSRRPTVVPALMGELFDALSIEVWSRRWMQNRQQAAA